MFWGLSESLDLLEEYLNALHEVKKTSQNESAQKNASQDEATPKSAIPKRLNILLFGAGDPRHLIQTMAKLYTHGKPDDGTGPGTPELNFYMLDGSIELVARNIALLAIALENPESFNLRSKVHLYMDVLGNTLLRPSSHQYLVGKAKTLLRMVTDADVMQQIAPYLNIEELKYRERDGLENAFNFWLPKEGHVFDVQEYWVARLGKLLGSRYDYREGAFDWDLSMVLKDREAKQICSQEYRYWRETGIAFTFPEYEQCKPNKTLSVGLVRNGEKYLHRGYAGDVQSGPFCGFGLRCSDTKMLKSAHGENDYRATDVTERNLLELLYELQARAPYEHDTELSRKYGCVRLLMGKRLTWNECDLDAMQDYNKMWINIKGVKVNFLSADEVFGLQDDKERWRNFFDVAFVGQNYFAFMRDTFSSVLRENGLLLLETKLLTVARKEEIKEFECKLMNYAKSMHLKGVINYNAINSKNAVLKFKKLAQEE